MHGLIDTNILIYASSESFAESSKARAFLDQILRGADPYALTWINIAEYLSFVTRSFGESPPLLTMTEARSNIAILLNADSIHILQEGERHWEILGEIISETGSVRGAFVHDCRIAAIMKENGVSHIFTRDTDFRKIPGIKVINPL